LVEVPLLLANADVGIVPKLAGGFGNEAYSTKIMEFMAARLPVVASRTRIDEYYFGGGQVHFFESGDPGDLARAVQETLLDPELRERLIAKGQEYVRQNNWSERSREYLALVDRLLNSTGSRS
jgi:glycosyltransferase involved in cell wall biosynthesis